MADLIPYDDRDGVIWYDGALVPWRDAKLHVLSHGLHYASCVFEGERVYDGRIFKVEEHTQRLLDSADALGFEIPFSCEALVDASRLVVDTLGIGDGYVRPVAWRGAEMMGVSAQHNTIHVAIAAWAWPAYFGEDAVTRGIKLKTARWRRPAPDTAPVTAKCAGLYMICTLSKHDAEREGCHDALMLDWRGRVSEATGANIFLVQDGVLHTPTPDCFLDGITRRTVIELAEKLAIPVATTLSGKGAINENHPLAVGVLGSYARKSANEIVANADLALIVGTRTGSQSTNGWTLPSRETDIIHINVDPSELGRNYPANTKVAIAADARTAVGAIVAAAGDTVRPPGEWVAEVQRIVRHWWEGKEPLLASGDAPIRPERLCRELTETLPPEAVVVADTGYAAAWAGAFVELRQPGKRFFRCEGSLGWALPAAQGVKVAVGETPVVCFTGDGGFWYHLGELETAVRYGLNIVYVVLNNHALAFDTHILDFRFDSKAYELAEFGDVDFSAVARAVGCDGVRVTDPARLRGAIEDALGNARPTVIDVVIDHDAVAPVTAYDRAGRRERMVVDDLDEIVTSRGDGGPTA
jgi:branched-chain amino acid aminotransferase